MKKARKIGFIVLGTIAEIGLIGLAIVGAGQIMHEAYYDPEHYKTTMFHTTLHGLDLGLNLGFSA